MVLNTPVQPHPLESTPLPSFKQRTSRTQHPPTLYNRRDRTALTFTYPGEDFGVKTRPFVEEHGDFGV